VTIIVLPVKILVTIGLPIYGNDVPIQQPIKINSYPWPGGEPLGDSPNGRSPGGGSLNQDPLGRSPLNPPTGFYGWQAHDPRIFMPPWY
jgi:hypothetical protein